MSKQEARTILLLRQEARTRCNKIISQSCLGLKGIA